MATNTKNFNFKKPDESDFYSIQDQNGNWDLADEELQKLNEPAFEDYTTGTSVPPAATALEALKSKIKLPVWMSNVVAFCKGCCTLAMIVNNCVSSDADKPLAAAQGKALQDQLTKLYSDLKVSYIPYIPVFSWSDGGANPTVQNMDVAYVVFSKICFVYARYNITDLGKSDRSKSFLSISLPKEIEPIAYNAAIISSYYQISNEYTPLGVRIENKIIYIVNGIGGDHSGPHIKTGYQGFSVFFMCK